MFKKNAPDKNQRKKFVDINNREGTSDSAASRQRKNIDILRNTIGAYNTNEKDQKEGQQKMFRTFDLDNNQNYQTAQQQAIAITDSPDPKVTAFLTQKHLKLQKDRKVAKSMTLDLNEQFKNQMTKNEENVQRMRGE